MMKLKLKGLYFSSLAWSKIKLVSAKQGISASELIEGWARSLDCN